MENYIQQINHFTVDDDAEFYLRVVGEFRSLGHFRFFQIAPGWCGHYIQSGKGVFQLDGRRYEAVSGDMIFFYPGAHILYYDYPETPWRYQWFSLAGWNVEHILRGTGITNASPYIRMKNHDFVADKLKKMLRNLTEHADSPFMPRAAAWEFIELLRRNQRDLTMTPETPDIAIQCKRIIDDELISIPDVADLASRLKVDRTTLYRRFRDRYGVAPKEYIEEVRFDRARKLLRESDLLIKEIAVVCGFSDQLYFSRKFSERVGCPPSEYRISSCLES